MSLDQFSLSLQIPNSNQLYKHTNTCFRIILIRVFQVRESSVLVVLQSKEIMHRPWCLLEIYTAIKEGIPIVAVNCTGKRIRTTQRGASPLYY